MADTKTKEFSKKVEHYMRMGKSRREAVRLAKSES